MKQAYSLPMPFSQAWGWATFVAALFLFNYMARSTLSPLLVYIEEDLQIGHALATSLLLMQGLGFASTQVLAGFIVGRIAPARLAACSLMMAGLCLMGMYFAETLNQARVLFFLFGCSTGFYLPAGMATLGSLVYPQDWGKAIGIHELAPNVGFILIPVIVAFVLPFTDWRGVFTLIGALTLTTGLLFYRFGRGGTKPTLPPSLKGSAELLRCPATWIVAFLLAVGMCGEFSVYSILQAFLVSEAGYDPQAANWFLSLSRLLTPVAVIFGGWAADHWPPARIMRWCLVIHAVALVAMSCEQQALLLVGGCIQALSMAAFFPSLFKVLTNYFSLERQALVLSFTMPPSALISAGLMPWFLGLCGEYGSFTWGFLALAVLSLLSLLTLPLLHAGTVE